MSSPRMEPLSRRHRPLLGDFRNQEPSLGRVIVLVRTGPVAFRLFVTDAISENAGRFYRQLGFEPLSDDWSNGPVRMVFDLKPLLEAMSGDR